MLGLYFPLSELQYCGYQLHQLRKSLPVLFQPLRNVVSLWDVPEHIVLPELCGPVRYLHGSQQLFELHDIRDLLVGYFLRDDMPFWHLRLLRHSEMRILHFSLPGLLRECDQLYELREHILLLRQCLWPQLPNEDLRQWCQLHRLCVSVRHLHRFQFLQLLPNRGTLRQQLRDNLPNRDLREQWGMHHLPPQLHCLLQRNDVLGMQPQLLLHQQPVPVRVPSWNLLQWNPLPELFPDLR